MLSIISAAGCGFVATGRFASVAPGAVRSTPVPIMEDSAYDEYMNSRSAGEVEKIDEGYRSFKGIDQEFDGGDSGGGVVGDGNTDLEDQHNSATLGALRGGVSQVGTAGSQVGRGSVQTLVDYDDLNDGDQTVSGDTSSRTASAGANYFGRSTGLAEKLINEGFTEDDLKYKRMDKVRAQQKENWFNQRAIHANNRAQGQGVVFGDTTVGKPSEGGYIARESMSRSGSNDMEISVADLANHMAGLASAPAERLDGEEWGALGLSDSDTIEQTFEVRSSPRQTHVTEIAVRNDYNTFAPYRCEFLPGTSPAYTVAPTAGSMNRRSGEPINVVVRYTPQETGSMNEAYLVFETEDLKKVYKFIGST